MSKDKTSLKNIVERLLKKNPEIVAIIEDNKGTSYKAVEPRITSKLCTSIGRTEGRYIKRNELIWACIDQVNGTEDELDY